MHPQLFSDKLLDTGNRELKILDVINGFADASDQPFNATSSAGNSGSVKNIHVAAVIGDQANIKISICMLMVYAC
jgi:hypothetical protein